MRLTTSLLALIALGAAAPLSAAPLRPADKQQIVALHNAYVAGWLKNDKKAVMASIADDAVFIPHDGLMPRRGAAAIAQFWFPGGKTVGRVPCFEEKVTSLTGSNGHATMFGRTNLHYDLNGKRYQWIGDFLVNWTKGSGRWMISHIMSSDVQPTIRDIPASKIC